MISLEIAKNLLTGQVLFCAKFRDSQGKPVPCLVKGKIKTWRRNPSRVRVPIEVEPGDFDCFTENDLHLVFLSKEEAMECGR